MRRRRKNAVKIDFTGEGRKSQYWIKTKRPARESVMFSSLGALLILRKEQRRTSLHARAHRTRFCFKFPGPEANAQYTRIAHTVVPEDRSYQKALPQIQMQTPGVPE